MMYASKSPAREFSVGIRSIVVSHVADIELGADEMITFTGPDAHEYDVVKKSWGYYATPSIDKRLPAYGLRAGLMRNIDTRHCFVVLVRDNALDDWQSYMADERQELVGWLDELTQDDNPKRGRRSDD